MNLEILTPGKKIYSGQVTLVKVQGKPWFIRDS